MNIDMQVWITLVSLVSASYRRRSQASEAFEINSRRKISFGIQRVGNDVEADLLQPEMLVFQVSFFG